MSKIAVVAEIEKSRCGFICYGNCEGHKCAHCGNSFKIKDQWHKSNDITHCTSCGTPVIQALNSGY